MTKKKFRSNGLFGRRALQRGQQMQTSASPELEQCESNDFQSLRASYDQLEQTVRVLEQTSRDQRAMLLEQQERIDVQEQKYQQLHDQMQDVLHTFQPKSDGGESQSPQQKEQVSSSVQRHGLMSPALQVENHLPQQQELHPSALYYPTDQSSRAPTPGQQTTQGRNSFDDVKCDEWDKPQSPTSTYGKTCNEEQEHEVWQSSASSQAILTPTLGFEAVAAMDRQFHYSNGQSTNPYCIPYNHFTQNNALRGSMINLLDEASRGICEDDSLQSTIPSQQDEEEHQPVIFDFYMNKTKGEQITDDIAAAVNALRRVQERDRTKTNNNKRQDKPRKNTTSTANSPNNLTNRNSLDTLYHRRIHANEYQRPDHRVGTYYDTNGNHNVTSEPAPDSRNDKPADERRDKIEPQVAFSTGKGNSNKVALAKQRIEAAMTTRVAAEAIPRRPSYSGVFEAATTTTADVTDVSALLQWRNNRTTGAGNKQK